MNSSEIDPTVKYFPPLLMEKLEYIKKYPFTLIETPSGFGKTTTLEHFFSTAISPAIPVFAYDFEAGDPETEWKSICALVEKLDPACARKLLFLGPPEEDNLQDAAQAIRGIRVPGETYLWLDNYRQWKSPFSGEFMKILTRHGSKNLHIVISTQPLTSMNSIGFIEDGRLLHLHAEDFTFSEEDIRAYFEKAGLFLTPMQIADLYDFTEGWIMALCLQIMCYITRGHFEKGGMDDLMEHILWEKLSPEEQDFLLHITIFHKFTLSQAAALTGLSTEKADRMLRGNQYFMHFDWESRCFFPHARLRRLLNERFEQLSPEKKREIYLRGGQVAEQTQDRVNTLRFYYAAGEWERLLSLPLTSYDVADVTRAETKPMILDILDHTPDEVLYRHPRAMIPLAFALFFVGENAKLVRMQGKITEIIQQSGLGTDEKNALMGELQLLLSFLQYNRISDMSAYHQRALELLKGPAKLINIRSTWTFGSPSVLYLYWRESGKLNEELREMDESMPVYYKLTKGHGFGAEQIMRAEAMLMRGQTQEALPLCYQALFSSNSHHQDSIYLCGLFLMCRAALQSGDLEELNSTREILRERAAQGTEDLCRYSLNLADGYISLLLGHPEEVAPWLSQGDIDEKRIVTMVQPFAYILYGRCLLARGEYPNLLGVSEYFIDLSSAFPNLLPQVYAHIYCACALHRLGRGADAILRLQMALDLAMPDRIYLPFAENYIGIREILPRASCGKEAPGEIARLAENYNRYLEKAEFSTCFTPREADILDLLKQNMTNKQIAQQLHLSPNTVRNTVSSMLHKKGFASREQLRLL